jgi:hypothetical protein
VATRARPNIAEAAIASNEAITRSAGLRRTARQYGEAGGQRGECHVRVLSSVAGGDGTRLDSPFGVLYPLLN